MSESLQIRAALVAIENKGVIICGKSGSGKSDLVLRLIENKNARLVADDVVLLYQAAGRLYGKAPQNLAGLLEVRGVGIARYPYLEQVAVDLAVKLAEKAEDVERMPAAQTEVFEGVEIPAIDLYAQEVSACEKIIVKLRDNLLKAE